MGQNQSRSQPENKKTQKEITAEAKARIEKRYPNGKGIPPIEVAILNGSDDLIYYHLYVREADIPVACLLLAIHMHQEISNPLLNVLLGSYKTPAAKLVKLLIDCGAKINEYGINETPLHLSLKEKKVFLSILLIMNGADINLRTKDSGATPLHLAAMNNDIVMVQYILDHADAKVDVNATDNKGQTPLHLVATYVDKNNTEIAKKLVKNGADIFALDADGKTPLNIAEENGNLELVEYLKSKLNVPSSLYSEGAKGKEEEVAAPTPITPLFSKLTLKSNGGESSTPSNRARSNSWPESTQTKSSSAMRPGSPF